MSSSLKLPFVKSSIPDPGSRSFCVQEGETVIQGFVVHKALQLYAYHNHCPHTGVSLNWSEDVFLNYDQNLIQCSMHGALFTIEEGTCIWGPCLGQPLQRITLTIDTDGQIFIDIPSQKG